MNKIELMSRIKNESNFLINLGIEEFSISEYFAKKYHQFYFKFVIDSFELRYDVNITKNLSAVDLTISYRNVKYNNINFRDNSICFIIRVKFK